MTDPAPSPNAASPERRSDLVVFAPWLLLGLGEMWFMAHGFVRHDLQQIATEVLCIGIIGACHARFAPPGTWRSPLIPGAFALAWTHMLLDLDVFVWIGSIWLATALVVRAERSRRFGLLGGVVMSLVAVFGVRWQVLNRASGGGGHSVARDPIAQIRKELTPPTWPTGSGGGPPVVLLTVDTLRADHAERMTTWTRLAERGRAWPRAASTSSWTVPGVASILTGELPEGHGAGVNPDDDFQGIAPGVETLATVLGEAGYTSAAFTTNAWLAGGLDFDRGFDLYRHGDANFMHRLTFMGFPEGPQGHEAEAVVDEALTWLEGAPDSGWFLWVHLIDPHLPFLHNEGAMESSLDDKWLRAGQRHTPEVREKVLAAYQREVDYADGHLGRLLDGLESKGVLDRGVVLMTADHGEEFWDHGSTGHGHQHHGEVVDVGLVLAGVGVEPGPTGGAVSVMDAATTLAAVAGQTLGSGVDLRGEVPEDRVVAAQGNAYFQQARSARSATARTIFESPEDVAGRCYDLVTDAAEQAPLACLGDDPVRAAAMAVGAPEAREGVDMSENAALKAMGYID